VDYEKAVDFAGDGCSALEVARGALMQVGFEVSPIKDDAFRAEYSGFFDTRRNPLLAASTIVITARGGRLALGADLGGIRKLKKFLFVFIGGMALLFLVGFGAFLLPQVLEGRLHPAMFAVPVAPFAPWPVLIPLILKATRARALKALDTLLGNIRTIGEEAQPPTSSRRPA
jgi:hypothetical protein